MRVLYDAANGIFNPDESAVVMGVSHETLNYVPAQPRPTIQFVSEPKYNPGDVNWHAFSEATEESARRFSRFIISVAAKHVGESKPSKKTTPWSSKILYVAINLRCKMRTEKSRNNLEPRANHGKFDRLAT